MKNFVLKALSVIRWIFIALFLGIGAIGFLAMLDLMTEEGGAPGRDPEAMFKFFLIVTVASLIMGFSLLELKAISSFFRRQYLWWRYKKVV